MDPVIVVGNGVAGVSAVEAFRGVDSKTPMMVIGEEPYNSYYRMKLSHMLGTHPDDDKLLIHEPQWYSHRDVEVVLDCKVTGIDVENSRVFTRKGEYSYSKLLLAQGSHSFIPPIAGARSPGVFTLRTLDDVKKIYDFLQGRYRGTVVGGGVLGLEVAWALAQRGQKICVIEGSHYILSRQLNEIASNLLMDLGKRAGIEFIAPGKLDEIVGGEGVSSLLLSSPNIEWPTDYVILSTGVRPNTSLVESTPIEVQRGILVDEYMQTTVENIYSAGDVAEFQGRVYGLWPVAKDQGKCAGLNMAGVKSSYREQPPSNFIKVFGVDIFSVGTIGEDDDDLKVLESCNPEESAYQGIYFRGKVPVGAIFLGDIKPAMGVLRAIRDGREFPRELIDAGNVTSFLEQLASS